MCVHLSKHIQSPDIKSYTLCFNSKQHFLSEFNHSLLGETQLLTFRASVLAESNGEHIRSVDRRGNYNVI